MEVAMPVAGSGSVTAMDSYEDMFKEITRKLYGEDGLPDLASGEKLTGITTTAERGLTGIDYDVEPPVFKPEEHITAFGLAALMQNGFPPAGILNPSFQPTKPAIVLEDKWVSNDDYLQWTQSKIASYNPSQKLFRCADCDCVGFLARVAEHWLGTHANLRVFQCPQCPYASAWARCVRMHLARQHNVSSEDSVDSFLKENPVFHEITRYLQKLKGKFDTNCTKTQTTNSVVQEHFTANGHLANVQQPRIGGTSTAPSSSTSETGTSDNNSGSNNIATTNSCGTNNNSKRYSCSYCPYATDRRDLFTRHENIHREEKPFQCYVCQKQFNRADHVKKHFLRMHREHPYDLNRIRRHPPKNSSGMSYYHKYNNGTTTNTTTTDSVGNIQPGMQHPITIPNSFGGMTRVDHNLQTTKPANPQTPNKSTNSLKSNTSGKSSLKKKGEKRYSCCYCSWSGVDNWCLKRHLNTHLKPFVCGLCDYKAARSERLATHVLKVHNKRACGRCLFLADDQTQLAAHQQEHHPLEQRNNRSANNVLRNNSFNTTNNQPNQTFGHGQTLGTNLKPYELSAAAAILQHGNRLLPMANSIISSSESKPWKPYTPKQHGAARLFNYMEASDGSEPECDTTVSNDEMSRMTSSATTTQRNQSDFPEAGDVGNQNQGGDIEEELDEEMELPLFICRECGCEFVDDTSLETHQYTHHRVEKITTSPATNQKLTRKAMKRNAAARTNATLEKMTIDSKENVNPKFSNYNCTICKLSFSSQVSIMSHMRSHISLNQSTDENYSTKKKTQIDNHKKTDGNINSGYCYQDGQSVSATLKRSRKQSQPRKVVPPLSDNPEIQVKKRSSSKHNKWQSNGKTALVKLRDKYMTQLLARKPLICHLCKRNKKIFPFHSKGSLALHYLWRHMETKPFECEHCNKKFRHRYQVVLHASLIHINNPKLDNGKEFISDEESSKNESNKQLVPQQNKEPNINNCNVTVPAAIQKTLLTTNVPDNKHHANNLNKLNIHPYMDPMLNSNIHVTNHIPIIIPTFPPS